MSGLPPELDLSKAMGIDDTESYLATLRLLRKHTKISQALLEIREMPIGETEKLVLACTYGIAQGSRRALLLPGAAITAVMAEDELFDLPEAEMESRVRKAMEAIR